MEMIHLKDSSEFNVYCDKNQRVVLEFYDLDRKDEKDKHEFEKDTYYIDNDNYEYAFDPRVKMRSKSIIKCIMGYTTIFFLDRFNERYKMKNLLIKIKKLN